MLFNVIRDCMLAKICDNFYCMMEMKLIWNISIYISRNLHSQYIVIYLYFYMYIYIYIFGSHVSHIDS